MAIYLLLVNALALTFMLTDKRLAQKKCFRIPEAVLLFTAFAGGTVGAICGMYLFSHKTRHARFAVGLPILLFFQIVILLILSGKGWSL